MDRQTVPYSRINVDGENINIKGKAIDAASIAGFRGRVTTLSTRQQIEAHLSSTENLVLGFGQVDLELGYYFRKVIKEEDIDPISYVDWLVDIYSKFILDLKSDQFKIAIKGVNTTALCEPAFTLRYVQRIIKGGGNPKPNLKRILRQNLLNEDAQNNMSYSFNSKMKAFATSNGMGYFDINETLADPQTGRLKLEYQRSGFDHHVTDNLEVRLAHLKGLFRAFDLELPR